MKALVRSNNIIIQTAILPLFKNNIVVSICHSSHLKVPYAHRIHEYDVKL